MFKRFNHNYFDLLWAMTAKEFTVRYKRAIFGSLWVIMNPLLQMLIIGIIFSNFVDIPNYFIFLFSGLLPWQFFSMTLTKVTSCFVDERALLQKSLFPKEIIPLSIVLANGLNLLLSVILFTIITQLIQPYPLQIMSLLTGIIWLILFSFGIALAFSSLNVQFRDISFFSQTLVLLWFYATPILYSQNQLQSTNLSKLFLFNPLTAPINLMQHGFLSQNFPSSELIIVNLLISIFICVVGFVLFRKKSSYFVDWI